MLTGSASGAANFTGATPSTNQIGMVSGFTAASFTMNDGRSLSAGEVISGAGLTIHDLGTLFVAFVIANSISLTASDMTVSNLTGVTGISLTATTGYITEAGMIATPFLSGSAAGSVSLTGSNTIAAIGNFTASGFTLNNGTDLSINGTLAGGPSVAIANGGSLTVNGSIMASSVSLTGANVTIPGFVSDGGEGTTSLIATAGTIGETGTLIAGTLSGSSAGATNLTGETPTTNQVAALGNFGAAIFNLNDGISLTIGGSVNGGPLAGILDNGVLTVGGTLAATNIGLNAFGLAIPGTVSDGGSGSVSLHATAGTISETGTLIAGVLGGDATGAASFTGASPTANRVATLGGFSAAGFTLNDGSDLSIDATVNGGASIALAGAGSISETGSGALIAPTVTGSAGGVASFTGANQIPSLGNFTAAGFTLNDVLALNVAGTLNGGGSAQLGSAGAINETGTIIAAALSGSAAGPANFTGTNRLGALGNFTAAGFTLSNSQDLTIAGSVNGGSSASIGVAGALTITGNVTANTIALSATGGMTIPGSVVDTNSVTLTAGGSIDETGTLVAGLLTGSAAGNASLTGGGNQVANLGGFTAGGSFSLTDATDLLISTTLTAPKIVIDAGGNQIVFADGATIVTGGTARPPGALASFPSAANSANGAFLSAGSFVQQGNSFLAGLAGGPDIVRIDASGGRISLDQTGGLQGPQTWLILGLTSAAATGNLFVQTLDLQVRRREQRLACRLGRRTDRRGGRRRRRHPAGAQRQLPLQLLCDRFGELRAAAERKRADRQSAQRTRHRCPVQPGRAGRLAAADRFGVGLLSMRVKSKNNTDYAEEGTRIARSINILAQRVKPLFSIARSANNGASRRENPACANLVVLNSSPCNPCAFFRVIRVILSCPGSLSLLQFLALALLAACQTPPPEAYVHGSGTAARPVVQVALGKNSVGEDCTQQADGQGAEVFCGSWQQPSARVRPGGPGTEADLARQATDSPWRAALDSRFRCAAPVATSILGGHPAQLMQCTRLVGGWTHVAMVALVNNNVWYADGVLPAAQAMERAIGVLSGIMRADAAPPDSGADALLASRLAARAFGSGDIGQFYQLMAAGTRANLEDNPGAAESAFRAALALQQKALGKDNPNTATTRMSLALQLSDEGRYAEADVLFSDAAKLAPATADVTAAAKLLHYRGLDALNQGQIEPALALLTQADAAYAAEVPAELLNAHAHPVGPTNQFTRAGQAHIAELLPNRELLTDPQAQSALLGLIEARRYRGVVLRMMGRTAEADAALASASDSRAPMGWRGRS